MAVLPLASASPSVTTYLNVSQISCQPLFYQIQFISLFSAYSSRKLTNSEVRQKKNELFGREQARQLAHVTRVEKIEVEHEGPPENCSLLMNKGLSTPFNVAMRK